ncbi:MAG: M23 family metallopeptidase [Candidatus Korobacteraceae bacterium]
MRLWFQLFVTILILSAPALPATGQTIAFHNVSWSPQQLATGSPCLFKVELQGSPSSLSAKWMGHEITFFQGNAHVWYGLAGIDVEAKSGTYKLALEAALPDGKLIHDEQTIFVEPAKYKIETLRVPDRYVQPDQETLRRIAADKEIKNAAFAHQIAEPEWSGTFVAPIDSTVSEGFGTRRTFNGKLASIHRGLDYHAKPGSPVTAANSGEVVLARELFYEGNCVIIDHGQQFMTLYMHLSKLEVSEGEKVEKGQQIGLSGATGRATGPHLHLAVRWQGAYLDPAQLLTLPLPNLPPALSSKRGAE